MLHPCLHLLLYAGLGLYGWVEVLFVELRSEYIEVI
jgi:hypothetical protein